MTNNRFETRCDLISTVLAFVAHGYTDYYQYQDGFAHHDYLEEQIALAARTYVAAVEMDDNKPVGWDDTSYEVEDDTPIGWGTDGD